MVCCFTISTHPCPFAAKCKCIFKNETLKNRKIEIKKYIFLYEKYEELRTMLTCCCFVHDQNRGNWQIKLIWLLSLCIIGEM